MINITPAQAQRMTAPAPFGLVSTVKEDGSDNLMAVSWWCFLTNHPHTLGVCLSKKGLSGSLIIKNGEFGLSLPGERMKDTALRCGMCSGKTTDKPAELGIELENASEIGAKLVPDSRVAFECRLVNSFDVGDHVMYVGEIVAAHGDESVKQLFAFDGYGRLDTV